MQAILGNAPTIDHLQLLSSVHSLNLVGELSSRSGHLQAWVGVMCPSWPRGMHSVSRVVHFEQLAHFRDERQLSASDSRNLVDLRSLMPWTLHARCYWSWLPLRFPYAPYTLIASLLTVTHLPLVWACSWRCAIQNWALLTIDLRVYVRTQMNANSNPKVSNEGRRSDPWWMYIDVVLCVRGLAALRTP